MLRVLVLLHDANDEYATELMSELTIINDGTGSFEFGNYDVVLHERNEKPRSGRVDNFDRERGHVELVERALMAVRQ
jgi:hypothetical protein